MEVCVASHIYNWLRCHGFAIPGKVLNPHALYTTNGKRCDMFQKTCIILEELRRSIAQAGNNDTTVLSWNKQYKVNTVKPVENRQNKDLNDKW